MYNKLVLVTGASRGLGKAIADIALREDATIVVSVSRSVHADHETFLNRNFYFIQTDLSKPFIATSFKILETLLNPGCHLYIFNNAGTITPISKIGDFTGAAILNSIHTNVTFPVSMINYIVGKFTSTQISFIDINSGAATRPIAYWSLYSSAKLYMKMFFSVLQEENKEVSNFSFLSIDPGALDTGMQNEIRESDFPQREYFENLKSNDKLTKPEDAAKQVMERSGFFA